jgi:RNA polymerase sigma factor (TIGR02999 family)
MRRSILGDRFPSAGKKVGEVTGLIEAAGNGDKAALHALFTRVYAELKQLARKQLAASSGNTLNTTALVHEVYLKLVQPEPRQLHGRVHFFALAAKAMRQIVVDHARARATEKRGGEGLQIVELDAALSAADSAMAPDELLRLDHALSTLEAEEPRLAQLVEWRFFGGLGIAEIAALQNISERTLNRDWRRAKAQLYGMLHPEA